MGIKDIEQRLVGHMVVRHDSGRVPGEQDKTFTITSVEPEPRHTGLFLIKGTGGVVKLWWLDAVEKLASTKRVTFEYNDRGTIRLARSHGLDVPNMITTNTIVYTLKS